MLSHIPQCLSIVQVGGWWRCHHHLIPPRRSGLNRSCHKFCQQTPILFKGHVRYASIIDVRSPNIFCHQRARFNCLRQMSLAKGKERGLILHMQTPGAPIRWGTAAQTARTCCTLPFRNCSTSYRSTPPPPPQKKTAQLLGGKVLASAASSFHTFLFAAGHGQYILGHKTQNRLKYFVWFK